VETTLQRILAHLSSKPQQKFMFSLLTTLMMIVGKANFRNMSRFSTYHEKSVSRWYQKTFPFLEMNRLLIQDHCSSQTDELIAVHDASFIKKSGKQTEGLGRFYSGCAGKALKGLEAGGLGIINLDQNTSYLLSMQQTLDSQDNARTQSYIDQVKTSHEALRALGVTVLVADGYYAKKTFIQSMSEQDLTLVCKLRKDCDLRYVYQGEQKTRGRRRRYAGKVNLDDLSDFEVIDVPSPDQVTVLTHVVYSMITKQKIRVVILQYQQGGKHKRLVLFSTDPQMKAEDVIRYYKARFQIEFCFRDAKQHTGLEDCQSLKSQAINFHLNASMTALNLLKLEDRLRCDHNHQKVISIASHKRRKYNQRFLETIKSALPFDQSCQKNQAALTGLSNFGCIAA